MFTLCTEFLVHQQLRPVRSVPANPVYGDLNPLRWSEPCCITSPRASGHVLTRQLYLFLLHRCLSALVLSLGSGRHSITFLGSGYPFFAETTAPVQQLSPQTEILLSHPSHLDAIEAPFNISS